MDETTTRLIRCFSAAFPLLSNAQIMSANADTLEAWDSVASVTLFAMIEEEFGIEIDLQDLGDLLSFEKILAYLQRENVR